MTDAMIPGKGNMGRATRLLATKGRNLIPMGDANPAATNRTFAQEQLLCLRAVSWRSM